MGSQTTSSGMRSDPVLELARRGAVQLAVGGGVILSITSLVQVLLGEPAAAMTLVAAIPTTVIAVGMLGQARPNVIALLSLITGFALAAEVFAAVRGETAYVAGIGAEVVVFGLGMLAVFVARKHPVAVGAGFLMAALAIVLVAQIHLNGPTLEIVSDIFVMLAVLGTLMYLVIRVMQSLSQSRARYVDLAKVIPVATFELDASRVLRRLGDLTGPEFAALASSHAQNELYAELMGLVRISYTNDVADNLVEDLGVWSEFLAGPNGKAFRAEATSVLVAVWRGVGSGSGEVSLVRQDGSHQEFIYRWALGQIDGRDLPGTLVFAATDVTRLRETEHELARQLEERDQFVASVSHELRTPLTSIVGLTEELVDRPQAFGDAEQAELLGIVAAEARDVADIVEDLLVTARAEAGQLNVNPAPCELGSEARRVADLLGGVDMVTEEAWTNADPVRLRQVMRNLLSNAGRHGGPDVRAVVRCDEGMATFEVFDNGPPLPHDERERIFMPYERVGSGDVVESVGLGLHVARVLARLMGGDLTYDHDGRESVFRLELTMIGEPSRELDGAAAM